MLLTILSSLKFCTAAAHYLHMYEKLYYFCSVVVYNVVLEIVKQFSISSICFLASSFFFFPIQFLLQNSDIILGSYYDEQQHLGLPVFKIHKWATAWRYINLRFLNFILLLASIGCFVDFFLVSLIKNGFSS